MYFNINEEFETYIYDDRIELIYKRGNNKSLFTRRDLLRACRYSSPNQLFFNGFSMYLLNYYLNYILPSNDNIIRIKERDDNRVNNILKEDTR